MGTSVASSGLVATEPEAQRSMGLAKKECEERMTGWRGGSNWEIGAMICGSQTAQQFSTEVRSMDFFKSSSLLTCCATLGKSLASLNLFSHP